MQFLFPSTLIFHVPFLIFDVQFVHINKSEGKMVLLTTKPDSLRFLVLQNSIISLLLYFDRLPSHNISIVLLHGRIKSDGVSFTTLPFSDQNEQPVSSVKRPVCLGMYIINAINKCSTTHTKDFCPFKH